MKKKTLLLLLMVFVSLTSWSQTIRLHANYPEYNKKQGSGNAGITVPSDNKTDWLEGDAIFFLVDGGSGDKGFKATYDGTKWSFEEWYKDGGMQDFNSEGGTVSFAMIGDNLNLSTMKPSSLDPSKTALQMLTSYAGYKVGDLLFTSTGTYTVDENGVVDIYLSFTRPMAKIHINGAYTAATQIRNQIDGTMHGGVDNAGGTNANYNKSKTMTLGQIIRYQPSTQTFRDTNSGNGLNGTANMVYATRPEDPQVVDAVYYGNMDPDENGDITIVMCINARSYSGIEANAALGNSGQVAYWRKFPGMTISPNDDIYIYGPMSEEEGNLWTSQAVSAQMNFTMSELSLAENQALNLKTYCKWKAPAPSNRTLTFEVSNPSVVTISEDGNTLYTHGTGSSIVKATTIDGYSSTMTVNVKKSLLVNEANFPDENFRNWVLNQSYCYDGYMMEDEIATVTKIDVSGKNINNLQGIEIFTALQTLNCNNNLLTSLDVSKNTALTSLYCFDNQLTSLDVSKNTALETLNCNNNLLTSLDVSKNTALTSLYCFDNQLTSLDVSKNTALEILNCGSNELTSLDVSRCTELTELVITENKIKGAAMNALAKSLPIVSGGRLYVIDNSRGYEQNVMTPTNVAYAKAKGWTPYYYYDGEGQSEYGPATWEEYSPVRGDANGDGEIGMPDVMYIVNYILGTPAENFKAEAADVNSDGEIGMPDVMFIVQYILNGKFPDNPPIIDIMENSEYGIFLEALQRTGLSSVFLKYKNDKSFYMADGTHSDALAHGLNSLYYPRSRDDGWTVFAEKDDVFRANGINNFEDLRSKCAEWYGNPTWYDYVSENGVQISTGDDYTNEWNVVHMFVAYHILNAALPVDKIVYEYSASNENWNYSFGYEPQNYYETLLPNTLMKFWETNPKTQKNLYINRYVKNNTLTDQYGTFGSDAMHPVIYGGAQINRNASLGLDNCYVHSIDKVLLYDENAVKSQHERMRFTQNQLLPELANNGLLRVTPAEISQKNNGGEGNRVALPLDYFNNLHCYDENMVLRYCTLGAWRACESTQLQAWGSYDYAIRLPHIPSGTYEIRTIYPPMARGGEVEYYIGNDSNQEGMKKLSTLDATVSPTEEGNSIGYVRIEDTEDYGVASDKIMHQNGYMRAPASFSRGTFNTYQDKLVYDPSDPYSAARKMTGGTSTRTEWGYGIMMLRYIIGTIELKQGQDYWLRIKNLVTDDPDLGWSLNFIELVPVDVYNNDTYMEDWY